MLYDEDGLLRVQGARRRGVPGQPVALPELGAVRAAGQLPGALPRHPGAHQHRAAVQQARDGGGWRHPRQDPHDLRRPDLRGFHEVGAAFPRDRL